MDKPRSLYIHIPFCVQKCAYCDFCSYPGAISQADAYLDALGRELCAHGKRLSRPTLDTLYIGGGTPTLLTAAQITRLLESVHECFDFAPHIEATVEANPGTLLEEKLLACVRGGINRLSLGMQAKDAKTLAMLSRIHDFAQVQESVHLARKAGIENISVDLMYALPGQTLEAWSESLEAALSLGIEHLSCYELTLEPGTPLYARVGSGELSIPDEEDCLCMERLTRTLTRAAGMHRYEISNYACARRESRHNKAYWQCKGYIGAGCAAHGYDANEGAFGVRYENTSDLSRYIAGEGAPAIRTPLRATDARFERLMLGLRMVRGMDIAGFERDFACGVREAFGPRLDVFIAQGLLANNHGRLRCTARGMDVLNTLLVELMDGAGDKM